MERPQLLEPPEVREALDKADAWIQLGNLVEAMNEIENLEPKYKTHPFVLITWCDLYAKAGKWDHVLPISETLCKADPTYMEAWEHQIVALNNLGRTEEAIKKAESIFIDMEDDGTIPYRVACCFASIHNLPLARKWLELSFERDFMGVYREFALENPVFEKIWRPD